MDKCVPFTDKCGPHTAKLLTLGYKDRLSRYMCLTSYLSLWHPESKHARCVFCNIPCLVDKDHSVEFLQGCNHLIHKYCKKQCSSCPKCKNPHTCVETITTEIVDTWLNTYIIFKIATSNDPIHAMNIIRLELKCSAISGIPFAQELMTEDVSDEILAVKATQLWNTYMKSLQQKASILLEEDSLVPTTKTTEPIAEPTTTTVTKGTVVTEKGVELFCMLSKFAGKCVRCDVVHTPGVSFICRNKSGPKVWLCTTCSAGISNEEMATRLNSSVPATTNSGSTGATGSLFYSPRNFFHPAKPIMDYCFRAQSKSASNERNNTSNQPNITDSLQPPAKRQALGGSIEDFLTFE